MSPEPPPEPPEGEGRLTMPPEEDMGSLGEYCTKFESSPKLHGHVAYRIVRKGKAQ